MYIACIHSPSQDTPIRSEHTTEHVRAWIPDVLPFLEVGELLTITEENDDNMRVAYRRSWQTGDIIASVQLSDHNGVWRDWLVVPVTDEDKAPLPAPGRI